MPMKYLWTALSVFALIATTLGNAAATQSTPESAAIPVDVQAALAAAVPAGSDLPVGYSFVGESFISASGLKGDEAGALEDAGFVGMYVSVYANGSRHTQIRSWASAWRDADAAAAGYDLLGTGLDDASAESVDIGEDPREAVSGTYKDDSVTYTMEAVAFRHDTMLLGTAVETTDGSEPDAELASDIAGVILERATKVTDGSAPEGIDLDLPGRTLSLGTDGTLVQAGFLGPQEVEAIYGTRGSVLSKLDASWVETVAPGDGTGTVTVGLTTFGSDEDAKGTVEQSADIFPALTDQQAVEDITVDGADSVAAYRYSSNTNEKNALNSYRIIFSAGSDLVVVDVQGAPSDAVAAEIANEVAGAQLSCQSGETCEAPDLSAIAE